MELELGARTGTRGWERDRVGWGWGWGWESDRASWGWGERAWPGGERSGWAGPGTHGAVLEEAVEQLEAEGDEDVGRRREA